MSSLNEIGFYTLTDKRAELKHTNLVRCEMIVTEFCNFKCPYCRGVKAYNKNCSGNIPLSTALFVLDNWIEAGLESIRFSGGEPTLYPHLDRLVEASKIGNIKNIAISTNGSMPEDIYGMLLDSGVNDFSISLDACCAEDANKMAGRDSHFKNIIHNIEWLSRQAYVTVGIVLTKETEATVKEVVEFAHSLGVADIRIISAAQYNGAISKLDEISSYILDAHPILKYRVSNLLSGKNVRGISDSDSNRCYLVNDDSVVAGRWHFPCVIYMREGGEPIGLINPDMRADRIAWSKVHNTHVDPICRKNCLDCLVDYNNVVERLK